MKLLTSVPRILLAILLTLSVAGWTSCSRKPSPPSDVVICPSSAFIDEKEYEIAPLESNKDLEYRRKMAEVLKKYPELKNAYGDLRECWEYYHGDKKK